MKTTPKLYPFSARKHAHDIEFARNRTFNLLYDAQDTGTVEEMERLEKRYDELTDLLIAVMSSTDNNQIAWLTGPQIAKAKEIVIWADNERHSRYKPNPNF